MHNQSRSILLALANLLRFEIMIYGLPSPRLVGFKFDFCPLGEKLSIIDSFLTCSSCNTHISLFYLPFSLNQALSHDLECDS